MSLRKDLNPKETRTLSANAPKLLKTRTTTSKYKNLEKWGLILPLVIFVLTYLTSSIAAFNKQNHDDNVELWKTKLANNDKQLNELYGPLYIEVKEGDVTWKMLTEDIANHRHAAPESIKSIFPLQPGEENIWKAYQTHDFLPRNRRIVNIIKSNTALLEGEKYHNRIWIF